MTGVGNFHLTVPTLVQLDNSTPDNDKRIILGQKSNVVLALLGKTGGTYDWLWGFGMIDWTKNIVKGVYLDQDSVDDGHWTLGITENQNTMNIVSYKFTTSGGLVEVQDTTK